MTAQFPRTLHPTRPALAARPLRLAPSASAARLASVGRFAPAASLALVLAIAGPTPTGAQQGGAPQDSTPHSSARLAVETLSARPGTSLSVGVVITLDPGWHTYWKNAGDSGSEALLSWTLPPGVEAGAIQWPRPERVPYPPLMSYAYHDEVMLLTDVAVGADTPAGTALRLEVRADWLVCAEVCLPAWSTLTAEVPVQDTPPASDPEEARLFSMTRALLPLDDPAWSAVALETPSGYTLEVRPPRAWRERPTSFYFFPLDPTALNHVEPQAPRWDGDVLRLTLLRSTYNTGPTRLDGVLVREDDGGAPAIALSAPVRTLAEQEGAPAGEGAVRGTGLTGLIAALLLAFGGGLLLNLMPCVFPVLSLKILSFVRHAGGDASVTRRHGAAFGAGVVLSFVALAAALLAVRAAGAQVGWGFQLQSPLIVALLAVLMFVLGLMLAGVLELGLIFTRLGAVGAHDDRLRGSFLTGVLATIVATPCTAPFMGAAIGVALVRPAVEGLAVFAVLGAGMATPYMVLSSWPALLDRVPRPGPWMETLKQGMAFPMFAVAVWLIWVFGLQTGMGGVAGLLTALTLVAFGCWVIGRWPSATTGSGTVRFVTRLLALAAFAGAAVSGYQASQEEPAPLSAGSGAGEEGSVVWEPFGDGSGVLAHRLAGRAVFVDFTAAWCISCQVNKRMVLSTREVTDAFLEKNVALIQADWTRRDPEITRALAEFGRSGVPLYVVYPPDPAAEPELLPAVLTNGIVLAALERATAAVPSPNPTGRPGQGG